jgi:cystathionine beta-lyase
MNYNFDEIVPRENTASYKYDLRMKIFHNAEVLPMWVADMDFKTPPFVMDALQRRLDHEVLGYTYIAPSVFESAAEWNKRRHGWSIKPEWISFSPGVVPALNLLIMAFTHPGDRVIIQPPVYFPFFSAIQNHHRVMVTNPLRYEGGRYSMDFDDLERKIDEKTRMMILCSPHNPTGNVWSEEDLRRIGEICLRHNMILVSDEIHSDLVYKDNRHIPVARLSEEIARNTITCMSPSKTFNLAGLSTSYLVISDRQLRIQYEKILDLIHVGAGNIFGFTAMEAAYRVGDEWVDQLIQYLETNLNYLQDFISRNLPMIRVIKPQATYLIWLDCRELGMTPAALKSFMIHEAGLGLNDGLQFGEEGEGFQRMNIACPLTVLQGGLTKLHAALTKYFKE